MSAFDTVTSITENIQKVLRNEGIHFLKRTYGDGAVPASLYPFGELSYLGETFPETLGERPGYAEAEFLITVAFAGRDPEEAVRDSQKWVHAIRGALTVNALNTGGLSSSKLVSSVRTLRAESESGDKSLKIKYRVAVRYREA